ncbi:MAG: HD domain-containing protein [Candidatus Magasanikiibacteriota bacterium]
MVKSNYNNFKHQEQKFKKLVAMFPKEKQEKLLFVYNFAKIRHEGQMRHDGVRVSYIIHPLRCAIYLLEILKIKDIELTQAVLLHDVVEDTETSLKEVENMFGKRVAGLVNFLTRKRRKNESEESKRKAKIKHFLKFFGKGKDDQRLLKSVDVLDNLRSMEYILDQKIKNRKLKRWRNEVVEYGLKIASLVDKKIVNDLNEVLNRYTKIGLFDF